MSNPKITFNHVETLPTAGYTEGAVYFVSSENKIYIRTANGWESYGASASGGSSATTDTTMSDTSTNPVQNKVIKSYVDSSISSAIGVTLSKLITL